MRSASLALTLALALAAVPAFAEPADPPQPPTTVSGVVIAPKPPKVTATWPAADQAVAPGVMVITLKFDQPMSPTGFDFTPAPGAQAPSCLKTPRLLNDGATFVLLCTTAPRQSYVLALNAAGHGGFANIGDVRAPATTLAFTTTGADGARNIAAAMKAAGLGDLDNPIEDSPSARPAAP